MPSLSGGVMTKKWLDLFLVILGMINTHSSVVYKAFVHNLKAIAAFLYVQSKKSGKACLGRAFAMYKYYVSKHGTIVADVSETSSESACGRCRADDIDAI
jgi:hypothetical protein